MDDSVISFIKQWLWAPLLGAVSWAWNRNEKSIADLKQRQDEVERKVLTLGSGITDRMMTYVDDRLKETREFVVAEDHKLGIEMTTQRGHIAKLFDKLEDHARRSEDRHVETLKAIHTLADTMHSALAGKVDK